MSDACITPAALGFMMPAEWAPHQRCFIGWPCRTALWGPPAAMERARRATAEVARAIARFEPVSMLARPEHLAQAVAACGPQVMVIPCQIDDSWLRDTGPSFVRNAQGQIAGVQWGFNGWGGKYHPHDSDAALATGLLKQLGVQCFQAPLVAEGGALHVDGIGTLLTTEQCLLNANRNPHRSRLEVEQALKQFLGVRMVVWLGNGLAGDETDGHVDNVACFTGPGKLLVQGCDQPGDPNYVIFNDNLRRLRASRDASGRPLEIVMLPAPRPRVASNGVPMVLSYVNFYLANGAVIMPVFDDPADERAAALIGKAFPDRQLVRILALDIVAGGGGIHCITQQMPAA